MFAYECGSLKHCNAVLSEYGPDSMKEKDRIVVKAKPGQETGIQRHNIHVVSFSGNYQLFINEEFKIALKFSII